jgi:hypothetical protein
MTDQEFWSIADEYEECDEDGQSYVPRDQWRALAIDICETNNRDYDESLADLSSFSYGKKLSEEIPAVCLKVVEKLCKKENK